MFLLNVEPGTVLEVERSQVGNKAYNLMVMSSLGLPVPKGCVIEIDENVSHEELRLYDIKYPVSVRSGGAVSMPGMMDTILNIGFTRDNIEVYSELFNSKSFALDCYRRLIQMFGSSVKGIDDTLFIELERAARIFYLDMDEQAYGKLVELYENLYYKECGKEFPSDPDDQMRMAIEAVKNSWNSDRAVAYREAESIDHDGGTAVVIQEMVFGNMNAKSGTGVVFSHNPNNGNPGLYGDFLPEAQGEDIVSGSVIPLSISDMIKEPNFSRCGRELKSHIAKLLREFKSIQDIEFTIENGKLFILQCRQAKCSRRALLRSALSMVNSGAMNVSEATNMVLDALPTEPKKRINVDEDALSRIGYGSGVTDGVAIGLIATTHEEANEFKLADKPYIYCADLTSPHDNEVMRHAVGVLTSTGGRLSHAAVLARSMEKVTVVGFNSMIVKQGFIIVDEVKVTSGEILKIDGQSGAIYI